MEPRLIDANELLEKSFNTGYEYGEINVVGTTHIEEAPTIDPVHAAGGLYCKECLHHDKSACPAYDAPMNRTPLRITYCNCGERKQNVAGW